MFQCDCPPDDCAGLVASFQSGNRAAGDELVRKFTPLVRSIVQRVLGPSRRTEWDDACQAIFLRLFANLGKWGHRCPFCKWLAVVAARRAIDLNRLSDPMAQLPEEEEIADPRPAAPDRETLERVEQVVARFPPEWKEIWEGYIAGRPREEMAHEAGKSLRTVQYWLAEMLDSIREELGE
jgi:RNA polymerase sigma-70 factor (ECF subfamily)